MAAFTILAILGLIIGTTAFAYRNCSGELPHDQISF
jgi:hypothetical protein